MNKTYFFKKQSERPRTSCSCGWEDRVRTGIQEGYISFLDEKGFGFICEDGSLRRGLYFHRSDVKSGINWVQLCRGMCVHFKVDENDKGCIAREVSVIATQVRELSLLKMKFSSFKVTYKSFDGVARLLTLLKKVPSSFSLYYSLFAQVVYLLCEI